MIWSCRPDLRFMVIRRFLHMLSLLQGCLLYLRSFDVFKGIIPFRPFSPFLFVQGLAFFTFSFLFPLLSELIRSQFELSFLYLISFCFRCHRLMLSCLLARRWWDQYNYLLIAFLFFITGFFFLIISPCLFFLRCVFVVLFWFDLILFYPIYSIVYYRMRVQ